jgi:hypothetical protein
MFYEPSRHFLYSAYKLIVEHSDSVGTKKAGEATAFVVGVGNCFPWIVTNRHVIDLDYKQPSPKYKDFTLSKLLSLGRRADDSTY